MAPTLRAFSLTLALLSGTACQKAELPRDDAGRPITLGSVRIWTYPKGAQGFMDGELVITRTPATFVREAGDYRLRFQVPGGEPYETTIRVEAGKERMVRLDLPQPPEATVTVTSDVEGAKVRINGYTRGRTPLEKAVTKPGPLDITVEGPYRRARAFRSELAIGEQKSFHADFSKTSSAAADARGRLTLGLKPDGFVFDEDGEKLGTTPLVDFELEAGDRRLTLRSADGARERTVEIVVKPGQRAVYRFRLRASDALPGFELPAEKENGE
ncbi:MAG: PEGA domain-containing protein [Myxococcota bacterium]